MAQLLTPENAVGMIKAADEHHCASLGVEAIRYVRKHFAEVSLTEDWTLLLVEEARAVARERRHLPRAQKYSLMLALARWADASTGAASRERAELLAELFTDADEQSHLGWYVTAAPPTKLL